MKAKNVIRYVPLVYLLAPSTGRQVAIPLHKGLSAADAEDLANRCETKDFTDGPLDILHALRLVHLIEHADDWRFMTEHEMDVFQAGIPPYLDNSVLNPVHELEV